MDTNEIIGQHTKKLKRIKDRCEKAGRRPNDKEIVIANRLLDEIEALQWGQGLPTEPPERTPIDTRRGPLYMGGDSDEGRSVGNLKSPGQRKEYRDLFSGGSRKEWTDDKMTFFEAVFSGRSHPELTKRSMTEGVPSDGGFLVPTEFSEKIHAVSLENELVMPRAHVQPMVSNEMKLPAMDIGDHSSNL